jgi:hypothetical protein
MVYMVYNCVYYCMQICEYVKKTVLELGFMGFMGFMGFNLPAGWYSSHTSVSIVSYRCMWIMYRRRMCYSVYIQYMVYMVYNCVYYCMLYAVCCMCIYMLHRTLT